MPVSSSDAVVVIVSPGEASGVAPEVVAGCESVLGEGHCVALGLPIAPALYRAEVTWLDPEDLSVRVRLFTGPDTSRTIFERQVAFLARDTQEQRRRAVGVIIAASVVSSAQSRDPHALDAPPAAPVENSPAAQRVVAAPSRPKKAVSIRNSARSSTASPTAWGVDAGPALASGLAAARPAVGLSLRGWCKFAAWPWRGIGTLSYAEGPYEPRLTSWTANLSAAARIERLAWLEPKLGFEFGHHEITATATNGKQSESARLLRYGLSVGSDFVLQLGRLTAILSSVEVTATLPAFDLWVNGAPAGKATLLGWRGFFGLRIGSI